MASITSNSISPTAARATRGSGVADEFKAFWRQFFVRAFDPYRPELHYMRGPGPAWHAKHRALSPQVQSMVVEIRAAKAAGTSAGS